MVKYNCPTALLGNCGIAFFKTADASDGDRLSKLAFAQQPPLHTNELKLRIARKTRQSSIIPVSDTAPARPLSLSHL